MANPLIRNCVVIASGAGAIAVAVEQDADLIDCVLQGDVADLSVENGATANVSGCAYATTTGAGTIAPMAGDRGAFDAAGYPDRHANDADSGATALHHTLGTGADQSAAGDHTHDLTDADAIHVDVASEIHGLTEKTTPADADEIVIEDSEDSYNKKRVQMANLPGGGGTDADAIHVDVASEIHGLTEKTTLADNDEFVIEDSADSYAKKRVKKANVGGGVGGGWPFGAISAPPSVSTFTWDNQGTASANDVGSHIEIVDTNYSSGLRVMYKAATPPFILTALVVCNLPFSTYPGGGILFRESASGKMQILRLYFDSGNPQQFKIDSYQYNSPTSYGSSYIGITPWPYVPTWLQIEDDGSNYRTCRHSLDGFQFRDLVQVSRTNFITADEVGFFLIPCATYTSSLSVLSWAVT